jgi:hypothetical protein
MNVKDMLSNFRCYYRESASKEKQGTLVSIVTIVTNVGSGLRLATTSEIESTPEVQTIVDKYPKGQWIAYAPLKPLPASSDIRIDYGAAISEEGPVKGEQYDTLFRTAPAFTASSM